MDKKNNIYNYQAPKSMNEETHYFLTKGRITLKSFFLRFLFGFCLILVSNLIFKFYFLERYNYWKDYGKGIMRNTEFENSFKIFKAFDNWALPILVSFFILIQFAKRMHDVNKSGWFALVPLYNIILLLSNGTNGNNDYGVNPLPYKKVKYFDELKK